MDLMSIRAGKVVQDELVEELHVLKQSFVFFCALQAWRGHVTGQPAASRVHHFIIFVVYLLYFTG